MQDLDNIANHPDIEQMQDITPVEAKKKKKHRGIKILILFLCLFIIAAGAVIGYVYNWIGEELDLMNHVEIDKEKLAINEEADKKLQGYRNILIMGIDKRKGEDIELCRSDAMIVAAVNNKSGKIKMVSVVRDSFLQLDEQGELVLDKLTHAHAFGGPENTIRAINRNLDLNIKEFIRIDWQTVADTVDNLGGLELDIKKGEIKEMNKYIKDTNKSLNGSKKKITKPGKQTLNGVQVVTYCRIRKNDGDEERAGRYRTALEATFKKMKKVGPKKIDETADAVMPQITTNISSNSLRRLMIKNYDTEIEDSVGWPYTWDGALLGGIWYDVPITLVSNNKDLHKDIYGQDDYKPSEKVKEINELIIQQSGYDENQPVQYTNKNKKDL